MIIASCLIAIIACATSQPQLGMEQFENISKQAATILKDHGSGTIDAKFKIAFNDGHVIVKRADSATAKFYFSDSSWHTKYKIVCVSKNETGYATKVIMLSHTENGEGHLQQNANLLVTFTAAPSLAIHAVAVLDCEQLTSPEAIFKDVSKRSLKFVNYDEMLAPSLNYWQKHISATLGLSTKSQQGISLADVNNDGLDDIYLPQPTGLPNTLLTQVTPGVFEDHSVKSQLDFLESSRSALFVDFDNDGDLDLATTFPGLVALFANDGHGAFHVASMIDAPEVTSLAAADYDNDGLVDLYACRYLNPYENQAVPQPYHDANNGLENIMLRNRGELQFEDVTGEVGLDQNNKRFSFAASFEDYDNDGDQDLYVANDYGRNNLFRNDNGSFTDVAASAGVEDISAGMAVSWGDYDNDGNIDLYVSNMYSSAGQRITYQRNFMAEASEDTRRQMQRHAGGNTLFKNMGDGTFQDVSQTSNTNMGRWAWGSIFFDYNNDSQLDIFVPNGFTTNDNDDVDGDDL